jgi:glycosyltransferase involved in cell wall biosynthesis
MFFAKVSAWVTAMGAAAHLAPTSRRPRRHFQPDPANPSPAAPGAGPSALRVLFLYRDLPFHGGIPRCLLYLARAFDPLRMDLHVASMIQPSAPMREAFQDLQIEPTCLGDNGYLSPIRRLRRLLEERDIEVVVATTFKTYFCAKWAVRGSNVGVVFWVHAVRRVINGPIRRAIVRLLSRNDPMLFVSRAVRDAHLPANHRGPAQVIYNGVEDVAGNPRYKPYGPEMRQTLGLPPDALVLAYVAEFSPCKDHPTAINAMHELARRQVNAHLLLIGTGEEIQPARALAARGPAAQRIHFLGARPDVRRIFGIVDIYLHPGREEGFGLAIAEAMLAGRPLAGAREGALTELIESGKTGVLFNPGDALDLADIIVFLAADRDRARRMGAAAREFCLQKFDVENFADAITRFLEDCFAPGVRQTPGAPIEPQTAGARG